MSLAASRVETVPKFRRGLPAVWCVSLTVDVRVRDVFTRKTANAVYPDTLQVGCEATKARKSELKYRNSLYAVRENLQK